MNATSRSICVWIGATLLALVAVPSPASAQWARVRDVPTQDVFTIWANGDTLAAGVDTAVYVSTDAGATWKASSRVAPDAFSVNAAFVHDGRLYAGTNGQGVLVSDDLGDTWADYNQGLSGLGSFAVADMTVHGDSLYLATIGGGPWVRNLASGPWTPFGTTITTFQASNMTAIAAGGSQLFAAGGFNGTVFYRDPGQPDWTTSLLFNDRFAPGLAGLSAMWTGSRWIVGSNIGLFTSTTGHEPWTFVDFGFRPILFVGLAKRGSDLFASLGAGGGTLIAKSRDDGVTWKGLDSLFNAFVYKLATVGDTLYASRVDGLWRRSIANVDSVPDTAPARLAFAIVGSPAIGNRVRFAFVLPEAGPIAIEVFDVRGRKVGETIRETRAAGHGEAGWDSSGLPSGVYYARLTMAGHHPTARLVHLR